MVRWALSAAARGKAKALLSVVVLSIALSDGEPPSEFRLFAAGENATKKGTFVFDEAAAKSVMAAYELHGIDLMIDYDHASLDAKPIDAALAGRAAGWFQLAVRNGELWAVNVRWTEPAERAIRAKEWRFWSPAFAADAQRVMSILNVAITNMPAIHRLEGLVAASSKDQISTALADRGETMNIDPKLAADAIAALVKGDAKKCMALLQSIVVAAATGGAADPSATVAEPPEVPEPPAEMSEVAAASMKLLQLTSAKSFGEAVGIVESFRTSHVELASREKKVLEDREVLERAERRGLVARLIELRSEEPSTAWTDLSATTLVPRLANEPIEDMRARVKTLSEARGVKPPTEAGKRPPVATVTGLSERELAKCARLKVDPEKYRKIRDNDRARTSAQEEA